MKHQTPLDETVCAILSRYRRIAVVGLSDAPDRPSNRVAAYLLAQGYTVFPVNPAIVEALGLPSYPNLESVPPPVEVVDVFRRAEHIPDIVEAAIRAGARAVWMQSGLVHAQAAERARQAGIEVVMDRCMMVEHRRHFGS